MGKYVMIAYLLLISTTANAATVFENKYKEFKMEMQRYAELKHSRENFIENFKVFDRQLDILMRELNALEAGRLTVEGNSTAYDSEMFRPLRELAATKLSAVDCNSAEHMARLNEKPNSPLIDGILQRVFRAVCGRPLRYSLK